MKDNVGIYFDRYAWYSQPLVQEPPSGKLGMVVTIPCFDEPGLIPTLESLLNCEKPVSDVEVLVLINEPANAPEKVINRNRSTYEEAVHWKKNNPKERMTFYILYDRSLPEKHAGVGLARKILMDEACLRLDQARAGAGIITGFDADCLCDPNYLVEVEQHFRRDKLRGACLYFEHPLSGPEDDRVYQGIASYEYHLRYYVLGLRYAGFPYSFHTIGSSMAVEYKAYVKQGGMNLRKAGEDFYFLHKIFPLGRIREINTTRVIPSPRPSHRVPFGTGRSMLKWQDMEGKDFQTYHPHTFEDLRDFFSHLDVIYHSDRDEMTSLAASFPETIRHFFGEKKLVDKLQQIREGAASPDTFKKNFFHWCNGLKILHFVHYTRDRAYGPSPVMDTGKWLSEKYALKTAGFSDVFELVETVRAYDRENAYVLHEQ